MPLRASRHQCAGWGAVVRLLLICALIICGSRASGVDSGGHEGRQPRRLLQPAEPEIAYYGQGSLLLPNATNGDAAIVLPGLVPPGNELVAATDNILPSIDACSSACRELEACNLFFFCGEQDGCLNSDYNLSAPLGGCQLVNQELSHPGTGRPAVFVKAPAFTGGAPLRVAPQPLEGYDVWPGLGYWYRYDYSCAGSVSQPGSCGLKGDPQTHAERCNADPSCRVMMYFPDGRDYPGAGAPVTLLKGGPGVAMALGEANFNQNSVLYMKRAPPPLLPPPPPPDGNGGAAGSGMHAGVMAGIVVAACFLAGSVIAAALFLARRHAQRQREERQAGSLGKALGSFAGSGSREEGGGGFRDQHQQHQKQQQQQLDVEAAASATRVLRQDDEACAYAVPSPVRLMPAADYPTPPAPPPTAASSAVFSLDGSVAAGGRPWLSHVWPFKPGGQGGSSHSSSSPRSCAAAAAAGMDPLLARLPADSWQRSVVDFSSITFCRDPDGAFELLGTGAFAAVYRVLLDRVQPHAAKVLRLGGDPKAQMYFLKEASMLRQLRHTNIVGFAGVCVSPDGAGIILMELMEGLDLRSRMNERDKQGTRVFGWWDRGKTVALDVASALHYLHSHNYTHFDIKSRNVLLSRDSTAKLADVGFTRAMHATHHSLSDPQGTFDYMAPELLLGRQCNSSVDIYSFGVLLWELCSGRYPTRGCMRQLRSPEECPQEVADLCSQCMDEEPAKRPSAGELVERLTELAKLC